jgi:hypothetical protein
LTCSWIHFLKSAWYIDSFFSFWKIIMAKAAGGKPSKTNQEIGKATMELVEQNQEHLRKWIAAYVRSRSGKADGHKPKAKGKNQEGRVLVTS